MMSEPVVLGKVIEADFRGPPLFDDDPGPAACRSCGEEVQATRFVVGTRWFRPELCVGCRDNLQAARIREERSEAKRRAAELRLARCGIPLRFQGLRLSRQVPMDDGEPLRQLYERCQDAVVVTRWNTAIIEVLKTYQPAHHSLYLMGPVGSGKTHLAAALAAELALGDTGVWFCSEATLLEKERRHVDDRSRPSAVQRACEVTLLIVDDFCANDRLTDWAVDQIEFVVSQRYDAMFPMVLTSNLPFDAVAGRYGQRVYSRLSQMVTQQGLLELGGPDWRAGWPGGEHQRRDRQ